MVNYRDLDAFKACHELALRAHRVSEALRPRDPELAGELWYTAFIASSRIVRGAAFRNRKWFVFSLERSTSALNELGYHLTMGRTLDLISEEAYRELEALRGRASFYTMKLLTSLLEPPGSESPAVP